MSFNPELRRAYWLEFTPTRAVGMPVILALIFLSYAGITTKNLESTLYSIALAIYIALSAWGAKRCVEAVSGEVQDCTWDFQRSSAMTAWRLAIGKLFGATIFQWYGAVLCLLVMVFTGFYFREARGLFLELIIFISVAVLLQAVALISSLEFCERFSLLRRTRRGAPGFMVVALAFVVFPSFFSAIFRGPKSSGFGSTEALLWWGWPIPSDIFIALTAVIFCGWAIYGAYRMMRSELQYSSPPLAWLVFLTFVWFYFTPFVSQATSSKFNPIFSSLLFGVSVFGIATYVALFLNSKNIMQLKKFSTAFKNHAWQTSFVLAPRWAASTAGMILFCVAILLVNFAMDPTLERSTLVWLAFSALLFVIRDVCFVVGLHVHNPNSTRTEIASLFYLVVLYSLVPLFLFVVGAKSLNAAFYPQFDATFGSMLAAVPGAVIAVLFLINGLQPGLIWNAKVLSK